VPVKPPATPEPSMPTPRDFRGRRKEGDEDENEGKEGERLRRVKGMNKGGREGRREGGRE